MTSRKKVWFALFVLFAINALNFFDRLILGAVGEQVRKEFTLDDASLGLLSTAFTLLYAFVGIPFGRLADKISRRKILSIGVVLWGIMTAASGIAQNFWQIFAFRLGVGVGEASCAPAAASLISDLFPAEKRARAMSIFMLGLPIGIALSFYISGSVAQDHGWRAAFFVAGIPGILIAILAWFVTEPRSSVAAVATSSFNGSAYRRILSSRTMLWLIASGAIHNFCLYALSSFMTPYLMRFHGLDIKQASIVAMLVNGVFTLPGLLLGGVVGDAAGKIRRSGGLIVVAVATFMSVPLFVIAIMADREMTTVFLWAMGLAFALMYFYYSITYAAIARINLPEHRGTAMSIYFMAMYLIGGALGPYAVGAISDHFTQNAAAAAGVVEMTSSALEPFRGIGLHSAMYIVPILCTLLALIMLFAAKSEKDSDVQS